MKAKILAKKLNELKKEHPKESFRFYLEQLGINRPLLVQSKSRLRAKNFVEFFAISTIEDFSSKDIVTFGGSSLSSKSATTHFLSELYNQDLFSSDKIVVISQTEKVNKTQLKDILAHLEKSNPPNLLILTCEGLEKSSPLFKEKKKFAEIEIETFEKSTCIKWIISEFSKETNKEATISVEAAKLLAEYYQNDLDIIKQQLSIIALFANEGEQILPQHIEALCNPEASSSSFELLESILKNDIQKSGKQANILLNSGQPPLQILFFLSRAIRTLTCFKEKSSSEYESKFLRNTWFIKNVQNIKTTTVRLKMLTKLLYELDKKLKSTSIEDSLVFESYIMELASIRN